jgi:hypothetical protein
LIQGFTAFAWVWSNRDRGICFNPTVELLPFVAGLVMLALGQALIRISYTAIGWTNVYYGPKLSEHITPDMTLSSEDGAQLLYRSLYKPHYVGTMLSVWSFVVIFYTQLPGNAWFIASFLSLMYSITAWVEDYL